MNLFSAASALLMFIAPMEQSDDKGEVVPVDFRVRTYTYHTYYGPTCPPGYAYGSGPYAYRRGYRFYAPGYFGAYHYGCYDAYGNYYRPRFYYKDRYYRGPYRRW